MGVHEKPGSPPVSERIDIISDMMRTLKWERGKSAKVLAELWGLDIKTVEGNSATASRLVKAEVMDPEAVRVDVGSALSRVLRDAMLNNEPMVAIKACDVWSTISGAKAPAKSENVNVDTVASTPSEAKRLMRELFGGVTPGDDDESVGSLEDGDSEPEEGATED